jgi:excisionase family DNA binding protein
MDWLTIQEAADLLRVRVSWLYERTRTNTVPHVKLGKYLRFDREELLAWARGFSRDGAGADPSRCAVPQVPQPPGRATRPPGGPRS